MTTWRVPLSDVDYGAEEESAVLRVLRSRWLSMGPEVETFEREFAAFVGVRHAIAVSSGTAALHLALLALDVGPGDEVIQPAINFVAAANMTVAVGATPVFVDIVAPNEPTIDAAEVERAVTNRTVAVVAMHYGGHPCRIHQLRAVCGRHRLALVEDACHSIGASFRTCLPRSGLQAVGSAGDIGCFSFFANKNLVAGEGGMLTTDRDEIARRLRLLRSHGMTTLSWDRHHGHATSYDVVCHGYNYRLDEIHAALGRTQLRKLRTNNEKRQQRVLRYISCLEGLQDWEIPFQSFFEHAAHHLMVVLAPSRRVRDETVERLRSTGVQTSLHYRIVTSFAAFQSCRAEPLDVSRRFAECAITLPLFPGMPLSDVDVVCKIIQNVACCGTHRSGGNRT